MVEIILIAIFLLFGFSIIGLIYYFIVEKRIQFALKEIQEIKDTILRIVIDKSDDEVELGYDEDEGDDDDDDEDGNIVHPINRVKNLFD